MSRLALFKQRTIWLPTLWGWFLIVSVLMLFSVLFITQIGYWLALNKPVADRQYLVVEGWQVQSSLLDALRIFEQDSYEYLITTGGPSQSDISPRYNSHAEQAAAFLQDMGLPESKLIVIPAPASAQNRTYLSALMVRNWFADQSAEIKQLNIHTSDVHARRTRTLYQHAFGDDVEIGMYSVPPTEYSLSHWWQSSTGAKLVMGEIIGNVYAWCCFDPGQPGSHYEKWAIGSKQRP